MLGFPDAEQTYRQDGPGEEAHDVIDGRHLTQSDAAELLGMAQPNVSAIRNY